MNNVFSSLLPSQGQMMTTSSPSSDLPYLLHRKPKGNMVTPGSKWQITNQSGSLHRASSGTIGHQVLSFAQLQMYLYIIKAALENLRALSSHLMCV